MIRLMKQSIADKTNNRYSGLVITTVKVLFFVIFIASIVGLFYYSSIDKYVPLEYNEPEYIEEWTVTGPDGNVFTAGRSYRNSKSNTGTFTMVSQLPDSITDESTLCFIVGGNVSVYIGGELREDFDEKRDVVIPGGCVKRFYMRVPLYTSDSGAKVKIVREGTTRGGYVYQNTFVADGGGFFAYMMQNYGFTLMLEEILKIGRAHV